MLKRILPLAVVLALLLPALVFPASAAIDYNDLDPNIVVDGDNDIVTISVPASTIGFSLEDVATGHIQRWKGTNNFSTRLSSFRDYSLYIFAFRYDDSYLDVTNIPDDTVMTFKYTISSPFMSAGWVGPRVYTQIWYLADGDQIGKSTVIQEYDQHESRYPLYGSFSYDMLMQKFPGAQEAFFRVELKEFCTYELIEDFNFSVDSFTLTFSISSLYRLQEQTGKTNEILKVVEKKLEENGQKLDDVIDKVEQNGDKLDGIGDKIDDTNDKMDEIINGEVDPERPEGSDSIDDLEQMENELLNNAQDGLSDYEVFIDDSLGFLEAHYSGFALMSIVFDSFVGVGWLRGIFVISLSLGIFGYLVNIGFRVAGDAKSKSAGAGKGGKGG